MTLTGALLAFVTTTVLIVLLRPLAISLGLVDIPTSRKSHSGNIPLIGGIAIFVGSITTLLIQHNIDGSGLIFAAPVPAFFASAFLLLVIGAWDDMHDLPAVFRLLAQVVACLIMIYVGDVVLSDLGTLNFDGSVLYLGFLAVPFTVKSRRH